MQVNNLGSLLHELPHHQLATYYHQQPHKIKHHQTLEQFLELYHQRRTQALADTQELTSLGVTRAEVTAKVHMIITKAIPFFIGSLQWKIPLANSHVDIDDRWQVRGLDMRELILLAEPCPACPYHTTGSITYSIKNLRTQQAVKIQNIALHCMEHDYFGIPQLPYRVDLKQLCQVLELGPYKNSLH